MIYFVDESRFADLKNFCKMQTIYSCRIMCLADSYGLNFDFVQFWLQYDENGNIVSAISKSYGDVTVQTTEKSNIGELTEFLDVIGFCSLLSDKMLFENRNADTGIIMCLENPQKIYNSDIEVTVNPDLNSVYKLLDKNRSEKFNVPDYEDFILDMSHKIRHNTAVCTAVKTGGNIVSAAMTVAQSSNTALIGAVITDIDFRRCGFGALCVNSLVEILGKRKIFIMRDENENELFYKSLGFENNGRFYSFGGENE